MRQRIRALVGARWSAEVVEHGRSVAACFHRHRSQETAHACAARMLRAEKRKRAR